MFESNGEKLTSVSVNVVYGVVGSVYWSGPASPGELRRPVPLLVSGSATSRAEWNNESERGLECRRGTRGGTERGPGSRFPGEECQHEQQSLPAAIHPALPLRHPLAVPSQTRHFSWLSSEQPLRCRLDKHSIRSIFRNRSMLLSLHRKKKICYEFFR